MPNTTAFEELPEFTVTNSAPAVGKNLGGQNRMQRQNSKGAGMKRQATSKAN